MPPAHGALEYQGSAPEHHTSSAQAPADAAQSRDAGGRRGWGDEAAVKDEESWSGDDDDGANGQGFSTEDLSTDAGEAGADDDGLWMPEVFGAPQPARLPAPLPCLPPSLAPSVH